jgi:hypothetical protein
VDERARPATKILPIHSLPDNDAAASSPGRNGISRIAGPHLIVKDDNAGDKPVLFRGGMDAFVGFPVFTFLSLE